MVESSYRKIQQTDRVTLENSFGVPAPRNYLILPKGTVSPISAESIEFMDDVLLEPIVCVIVPD